MALRHWEKSSQCGLCKDQAEAREQHHVLLSPAASRLQRAARHASRHLRHAEPMSARPQRSTRLFVLLSNRTHHQPVRPPAPRLPAVAEHYLVVGDTAPAARPPWKQKAGGPAQLTGLLREQTRMDGGTGEASRRVT